MTANASNSYTFNSNTPLAIPDYSTVTSSLDISGLSGSITDVNVLLNISHSWNSDLRVYLIAPSGTQVELFTEVGIGGQGFLNTLLDDEAANSIASGSGSFSGTFRPEGKLSAFDGSNGNGIWKLKIIDAAEGDTGKLNSWSLILNGGTTPPPPPPPPSGGQIIYGTVGNDILKSGTAKDTLIGGKGDDIYIVDGSDIITELPGEGVDTIETSVSYTMTDNYINNLTLTGSAVTGVGNSYNNVITGNGVNNNLTGGASNDTLIGGGGADRFIFNVKGEGIDRITDFSVVDDTIVVSAAGFGGGLISGKSISLTQWVVGKVATASSHRFIYNKSNGNLFFDSDGNGANAPIQLAVFNGIPNLTNHDILVTV
jgi:Ca2+-binding RTX toxin-like protein